MKRTKRCALSVLVLAWVSALPAHAAERTGKVLFEQYCASCHPDGGNVIKPDKNLYRLNREAKGISRAKDVVARMRKPTGSQMPRFDRSYLSDAEALRIGEYVVTTFR